MAGGMMKKIPLYKWIGRSFLGSALFPLVLVELVMIFLFFLSNNWNRQEMNDFLRSDIRTQMQEYTAYEVQNIASQLQGVANSTNLLRKRMAAALAAPAAMSREDGARLALADNGVYHTFSDLPDGGAAVFYSGIVPVGDAEREKVARALTAQYLLKDMTDSEPLVISSYLNTFDSLNVIYPYFDVLTQYPAQMDIPAYNFYYEADLRHNPDRNVRWTDVYLDPAGHGWMASAIAPVYKGDFLEGVVGLDVSAAAFTDQILALSLPWSGYGILLGKDGTILALPEAGESDWNLLELKTHHYNEAIRKDTFKPDQFNLYKRNEDKSFVETVSAAPEGFALLTIGGNEKAVSWATVPETGWKLLLLISESSVFEKTDQTSEQLDKIGLLMIGGLVLFSLAFIVLLLARARRMSRNLSQPLEDLNAMVRRIGEGQYRQIGTEIEVQELHDTGLQIVRMGQRLGEFNEALISAKEVAVKASLAKSQFLSHMSHELRTPLHAILGFVQVIGMDTANLPTEGQKDSLGEIEKAGRHLLELINDVLDLTAIESGKKSLVLEQVNVADVIGNAVSFVGPLAESSGISLMRADGSTKCRFIRTDRLKLRQILLNLLTNAIKYNKPQGRVQIDVTCDNGHLSISVSDTGIGILPEDREIIFDPFHRIMSHQFTEGAGIGLTVTRQLVELLGGSIALESEFGEGSRFIVTFPYSKMEEDAGDGSGEETAND